MRLRAAKDLVAVCRLCRGTDKRDRSCGPGGTAAGLLHGFGDAVRAQECGADGGGGGDDGSFRRVDDEGLRRDTTIEKLGSLKPAFEDAAMAERFPEIHWSVTAGNSRPTGAAAVLIAEELPAQRLGLKARAAKTHFAVAGDDPIFNVDRHHRVAAELSNASR